MGRGRYCAREVVPFIGMVMGECTDVGLNTIFKAATLKGLDYHVFMVYTYAISTLFAIPLIFIFHRDLPPIRISFIIQMFLLAILGFIAQMIGYKGIEYASPTLGSAMSNLTPACTFVFAIIFSTRSSLSKIDLTSKIDPTPSPFQQKSSSSSPEEKIPIVACQNCRLASFVKELMLRIHNIEKTVVSEVLHLDCCWNFFVEKVPHSLQMSQSGIDLTSKIDLTQEEEFGTLEVSSSRIQDPISGRKAYNFSEREKASQWKSVAAGSCVLGRFDRVRVCIIGAIIISFGFYVVIWAKTQEEEEEEDVCEESSPFTEQVPLLQGNNGTASTNEGKTGAKA
ncbi:hypothetical protein LguiA_019552 [Lonicera macranthoides]